MHDPDPDPDPLLRYINFVFRKREVKSETKSRGETGTCGSCDRDRTALCATVQVLISHGVNNQYVNY